MFPTAPHRRTAQKQRWWANWPPGVARAAGLIRRWKSYIVWGGCPYRLLIDHRLGLSRLGSQLAEMQSSNQEELKELPPWQIQWTRPTYKNVWTVPHPELETPNVRNTAKIKVLTITQMTSAISPTRDVAAPGKCQEPKPDRAAWICFKSSRATSATMLPA